MKRPFFLLLGLALFSTPLAAQQIGMERAKPDWMSLNQRDPGRAFLRLVLDNTQTLELSTNQRNRVGLIAQQLELRNAPLLAEIRSAGKFRSASPAQISEKHTRCLGGGARPRRDAGMFEGCDEGENDTGTHPFDAQIAENGSQAIQEVLFNLTPAQQKKLHLLLMQFQAEKAEKAGGQGERTEAVADSELDAILRQMLPAEKKPGEKP